MGEGVLAAERGQRPALRGFDRNTVDLNSAEAVVNDLRVGRGGNSAVNANSNREDGRHDYGHFGSCRVAADAAVSGGRERDAGSAGAARSINRVGSGSADCKACHQADSENEGNDLLKVFHCSYSFDFSVEL